MKNVTHKREREDDGCESKRAREEEAAVTREEEVKPVVTWKSIYNKIRNRRWADGVKSAITIVRDEDIEDRVRRLPTVSNVDKYVYALAEAIGSFLVEQSFTGNTYSVVFNSLQGEGRELSDYDAIQADLIAAFENYSSEEESEEEEEDEE